MNPTPTPTLIKALRTLACDIQSGDGVANAAIAEAAERMETLVRELAEARQIIRDHDAFSLARQNERDALRAECERLKESHAKIYLALGTQESDCDKWPEQINQLRARVESLEQDKARLDWLEDIKGTLPFTYCGFRNDDGSWNPGQWCNVRAPFGRLFDSAQPTIRQAIDAARLPPVAMTKGNTSGTDVPPSCKSEGSSDAVREKGTP